MLSSPSPIALVQYAYVVPNLERACMQLNRTYGLGPFVGGGESVIADHVYRGVPSDPIVIRGAFVQSGELNVEVIELVSAAPSAFHDMYPVGGAGGLHHCAYFSVDYEADKQRFIDEGFPVVSEFSFIDQRICYVDTRPMLGHMTEIYPEMPLIRAMYGDARSAAASNPGDPSFRPFEALEALRKP